MEKTRQETVEQVMALCDTLVAHGHKSQEIVAALISCSLITMIEDGLSLETANKIFETSAHFAYTQQEKPYAINH